MSTSRLATDPIEKDDPELVEYVALFESRVHAAALRVMRRWGLPESGRDDLVSSGYLGLLKALQNRRPDAHALELSAYVSRRIDGAVLDEARTLLGRASRVATVDPDVLEADVLAADREEGWTGCVQTGSPESRTERGLRWRRVEEALGAIDGDARAVLLQVAEGCSIAELARDRGVSAGRLQARLTRATRQLRGRRPELRRLLREEL